MQEPVHETLHRGETMFLEVRLVGESLAGVVPYVRADAEIPVAELSVTKILPDTITIRCEDTSNFGLGTPRLQVWVEWPDGDVINEMVCPFLITVKEPPEVQE